MELLWDGLVAAIGLILQADPELQGIVMRSPGVSGAATVLAAIVGVPTGVLLHLKRFRGRWPLGLLVNTGMGLPPVVVGLVVTLLLWRTGPFGALRLLYTPSAMVLAQLLVAMPLVAGFTRAALALLDPDLIAALRADGAGEARVGYELVRAAAAPVLVAIAAGFGRAISEVGASLMVGQHRRPDAHPDDGHRPRDGARRLRPGHRSGHHPLAPCAAGQRGAGPGLRDRSDTPLRWNVGLRRGHVNDVVRDRRGGQLRISGFRTSPRAQLENASMPTYRERASR